MERRVFNEKDVDVGEVSIMMVIDLAQSPSDSDTPRLPKLSRVPILDRLHAVITALRDIGAEPFPDQQAFVRSPSMLRFLTHAPILL